MKCRFELEELLRRHGTAEGGERRHFSSLVNSGLFVFGTVESVRRQMVEQWEAFPAEYVTLINHCAQTPKDVVIETLDAFMRHVKPAMDEVIDAAQRKAA